MNTLKDFMFQVVAWPEPGGAGFINLHWETPHIGHDGKPIWGGKPFKEIDQFLSMVKWGATKPSIMKNIFFCLSTQSTVKTLKSGKLRAMRSAATALALKAIWLDVDVGKEKGYATLEDALEAVNKFVLDANLPPPSAFVFSGGGIHIYWISDVPLSKSEWLPYAEGLRSEASRLGLKFDEGVTTDAARVLRVPTTANRKTSPPRACRLAGLGRPHNFAVGLARLASIVPAKVTAAVTQGDPVVPFDLTNFKGWHVPPEMAALNPLDCITIHEKVPLSPDEIFKNCPHFMDAAMTHGAGYGQGLWMFDVMACTFLDDGRRWAHYLSKGHKTYTEADTDAMYDRKEADGQKFGWPSCTAFENEGCKLCKTCVFKGTIKSPLNLAVPVAPLALNGESTQAFAEKATAWNPIDLKVSFSNIPHRPWLYGTYLLRGEITYEAAPGGVGKTAHTIGMAVELATGIEILGEKIWTNDLKVLYINAEDSRAEINRRLSAFYRAHAPKLAECNLDRLSVVGVDDPRIKSLSFLRVNEKGATILNEAGVGVLETALEALRPGLLVLDPLVAFCGGGNMNDNAVMAVVSRELKRLATKFDCAILILHHTRKGSRGSDPGGEAEEISGASSIVNLARRAITLKQMTEPETKLLGVMPSEKWQYLKLVDVKSNLAPRSADCPWYRLHSVELPNPEPPIYPHGDSVQAIARVHLPLLNSAAATNDDQKIQDAILNIVARGKIIDGQSFPYSPSVAGAHNERALLDDAIAVVANATAPRQWHSGDLKAVTERTIAKMKEKGLLVEEQMPSTGRFRRGRALRVDQSRIPDAARDPCAPLLDLAVPASKDLPDAKALNGGQLVNSRSMD